MVLDLHVFCAVTTIHSSLTTPPDFSPGPWPCSGQAPAG